MIPRNGFNGRGFAPMPPWQPRIALVIPLQKSICLMRNTIT
jgi:hypothetical protein